MELEAPTVLLRLGPPDLDDGAVASREAPHSWDDRSRLSLSGSTWHSFQVRITDLPRAAVLTDAGRWKDAMSI